MKKLIILLAIFTTVAATAQSVGINADGSVANATAILDLKSTTKGFLPPRMTYSQRETITSPAIGLMIYCTDCGNGEPQYYSGAEWKNMIGGTAITQPPTVASTTAASSIARTSATSGGNITNDFGHLITARGVCWSTSQNPTTADSKTIESGTTGSFTSIITGLTGTTLYYVRAYATNAAGTGYAAQESFTTTSGPQIGDSYQGGKIAYILQSGEPGYDANVLHGLIAAPSNQSSGAEWGCYGYAVNGADGTAYGTGNQNTIDIMNSCATSGIAARLCADLVLGGYSDWYLPSLNELNKLYINKATIGGFADNEYNYYWSSTENNSTHAWTVNFTDGSASNYGGKYATYFVRAVRTF